MTNPTNANASLAGEANAESADMSGLQDERSTGENAMCEVAYSRGMGQHDNTPAQRTAPDFAAFRDAILADRATGKGQQWIAGAFAIAPDDAAHQRAPERRQIIGKPHRCHACALPRGWVGLDVDGHGADFTPEAFAALVLHLQRYSGLVYTTASHTDAAPRCRIVLELDLAAPRAELIHAAQAIRARIAAAMTAEGHDVVPFDTACDRPEQPLFLPVTDSQIFRLDGVPLALGELLADALPVAAQDAPQAPRLPEGGIVVDVGRHPDANALTGRLARSVVRGDMTEATAWAAILAERDRGRWTRQIDDAELRRGFDGALAKLRSGEWKAPELPAVAANDAQLVAVDLGAIMGTMPPAPRFIIDPLVPRRVATLLGGHGGLGKSMLGLTLCAHVAAGRGWAGFPVTQARAVFVSLEDEAAIVAYRLRRIIERYALPAHPLLDNLRVFDGTDVEAALMVEANDRGVTRLVETPMLAEVEQAVSGAGFVVLDNASDAYGGNENTRLQVRVFMRRLARIAKANDAGLVLLAHVDKDAAKHGGKGQNYSGSTAWNNSSRSRLALVQADGVTELRHEKANLGKKAEPVRLQCAERGVLVPAAGDGSREAAEAVIASADAAAVLDVLRIALQAGMTVPAATSGPVTAWHALATLPELGAQYQGTAGKRRVASALVRLAREGKIVRATYKKPDRHMGERWELPQDAAVIAA